jgi:transposase
MGMSLRSHSANFKFKVALEALKEIKSINQIASEYEISSSLVCDWKKLLLANGFKIYEHKSKPKIIDKSEDVDFLQKKIGQLTVDLEWLKKKHGIVS